MVLNLKGDAERRGAKLEERGEKGYSQGEMRL